MVREVIKHEHLHAHIQEVLCARPQNPLLSITVRIIELLQAKMNQLMIAAIRGKPTRHPTFLSFIPPTNVK